MPYRPRYYQGQRGSSGRISPLIQLLFAGKRGVVNKLKIATTKESNPFTAFEEAPIVDNYVPKDKFADIFTGGEDSYEAQRRNAELFDQNIRRQDDLRRAQIAAAAALGVVPTEGTINDKTMAGVQYGKGMEDVVKASIARKALANKDYTEEQIANREKQFVNQTAEESMGNAYRAALNAEDRARALAKPTLEADIQKQITAAAVNKVAAQKAATGELVPVPYGADLYRETPTGEINKVASNERMIPETPLERMQREARIKAGVDNKINISPAPTTGGIVVGSFVDANGKTINLIRLSDGTVVQAPKP